MSVESLISQGILLESGVETDGAEGATNSARHLTRTARIDSTEGATMADRESTGGRVRCGGCPQTWTALGAAHCPACHVLFSTAAMFDKHRAGKRIDKRTVIGTGTCTPPVELGMVENDRGSWGMPAPDPSVWDARSRTQGTNLSAEPALSGVTGPEAA